MSIYILGQGVSPFEDSEAEIQHHTGTIIDQPRRFEVTQNSGLLATEQVEEIVKILNWDVTAPVQRPNQGRRTSYDLKSDQNWPVASFDIKGGLGLKELPDNKWECNPPYPEASYGIATQYHIDIAPDLKILTVEGRQKALNCLGLDRAEMEFNLQNRLHEHDLGFRALLAGQFIRKSTDEVEVDRFTKQPIGAVVMENDPSYRPLQDFISVFVTEDRDGGIRIAGDVECDEIDELIEKYLAKYSEIVQTMGDVKRRVIIETGIGRHAGHIGNFLFNPETEDIKVKDLDSCIDIFELPPEKWGPQLLRDFMTDTLRVISTVSFFVTTPHFLQLMNSGKFKPFHQYLKGFWGTYVSEEKINEVADFLHQSYLQFRLIMDEKFQFLAQGKHNYFEGDRSLKFETIRNSWVAFHQAFYPFILEAGYQLIQSSEVLKEKQFTLPEMAEPERAQLFNKGIEEHLDAITTESDNRISQGAQL